MLCNHLYIQFNVPIADAFSIMSDQYYKLN